MRSGSRFQPRRTWMWRYYGLCVLSYWVRKGQNTVLLLCAQANTILYRIVIVKLLHQHVKGVKSWTNKATKYAVPDATVARTGLSISLLLSLVRPSSLAAFVSEPPSAIKLGKWTKRHVTGSLSLTPYSFMPLGRSVYLTLLLMQRKASYPILSLPR